MLIRCVVNPVIPLQVDVRHDYPVTESRRNPVPSWMRDPAKG
jgi:hypothetical protein